MATAVKVQPLGQRSAWKALEIHPSMVEAHTNLGVQYCKAEQYEKGVEQFQLAQNLVLGGITLPHLGQAIGCDPPSGAPQLTQLASPTLLAVSQ